jgi:uncharacterized protein
MSLPSLRNAGSPVGAPRASDSLSDIPLTPRRDEHDPDYITCLATTDPRRQRKAERDHSDAALAVSTHVKVLPRNDGSFVAFHCLFGNFSVLDRELADAIQRLRSTHGTLDQFNELLGVNVASALYAAYYLAEEGEERRIVENWLAERSANVSGGRYLDGLQITSSNACNFACSYCFADSSDRRSPQRQSSARTPNISFETACQAIDHVLATARSHGRHRIGVKFLGREPLVNYKVMDRLFDRYSPDEVAWSITTNGSLVTPQIAARLAEVNARTVVSIDGLPEVNDALRVVKSSHGEQSAYKLAMRGLEALFAAGVPTSVSSVVSAKTDFAIMPKFLHIIREAGCREVQLTLAMQTDTLQPQKKYSGGSDLVTDLVSTYHEATRLGLFVSGDWIDPYHAILANHKFRDESVMIRPHGAGCQATEHQISVEPDGDLFPCRAMSLHYGTLSNWEDVLAGEAYRKVVMRTFFAVPYCRGCILEGHCQGTCLGSLEEASGDIYSPQAAYCNVYRTVTSALLPQFAGHEQ